MEQRPLRNPIRNIPTSSGSSCRRNYRPEEQSPSPLPFSLRYPLIFPVSDTQAKAILSPNGILNPPSITAKDDMKCPTSAKVNFTSSSALSTSISPPPPLLPSSLP